MQNNAMIDILAGDEPFPAYKKDLMLYGQLVGSWSVQSTWYDRNGEIKKKRGEWHFGWVLGGRGIQDVLFAEGATPDQYGTTLRCYDPALKIWHVSWMQPYGREFVHLIGKKVGLLLFKRAADWILPGESAGPFVISLQIPFFGWEKSLLMVEKLGSWNRKCAVRAWGEAMQKIHHEILQLCFNSKFRLLVQQSSA